MTISAIFKNFKNFFNNSSNINVVEDIAFNKPVNVSTDFYKDNIIIKGILKTVGFWTQYIRNQNSDLVNTQLLNYNNKKGYYENLVIAQRMFRDKRNKSNFNNRY